MGERKVLNKYYPPDFDPALLPRNKKPKDKQIVVRVMLPFSMQCQACGEYIYRGKKFNARKEWSGEDYLGIKIWRFYLRCTSCMQEITFKTDPKNADYVCEAGAARNFEPWRQEADAEDAQRAAKEEEEVDAMKALENRMIQSKREMDAQDALEEILDLNARNAGMTADNVIDRMSSRWKEEQELALKAEEEADEKLLNSINFNKKSKIRPLGEPGDGVVEEEEVSEEDSLQAPVYFFPPAVPQNADAAATSETNAAPPKPAAMETGAARIVVKRKDPSAHAPSSSGTSSKPAAAAATTTTAVKPALSLVQYGDDDDD